MTITEGTNTSSPSTTWVWRKVRLRAAPAKGIASPPKADRSEFWVRLNWRKPQGVTLQYKGGSTCSVVVCRGRKCWRFDGYTAIYDVLRWASNDEV